MANPPVGPKPLVFSDASTAAPVQGSGPKALSFDSEPAPSAPPGTASPIAVMPAMGPKPLSFDSAAEAISAQPKISAAASTPGAIIFSENFKSLPTVEPVKALFEQDDHPAMRTAIETAKHMFPDLYRKDSFRMDAYFRKLLPVRTETIHTWSEKHLVKGPELALRAAELIQQFARLDVPTLLAEALESTKPPAGLFQKLLQRQRAPAEFLPLLRDAGATLDRIRDEAQKCSEETSEFAEKLTVKLCSLVVIADVAGQATDAALDAAFGRRRTMIQQTVQQAGLSLVQLSDLQRQAVNLSSELTSFTTVTLPAMTMAQAQPIR